MTMWTRKDGDGVAVLTYRNPPRNFLTFAALEELDAELARLETDPDISVVMLTSGVPGYFVAHADLDELAELSRGPVPRARIWYTAMRRIERLPQPVIAAMDGQAWGGGLELSLACTLRWASADAHFSLLETALGIIPGAGGTQRLARLIGPGRAADVVLSGDVRTAEQARTAGVVERVLPTPVFQAEALRLAHCMASRPAAALAAAKRALGEGSRLPLTEGLRLEAGLFAERLASPESRELLEDARRRYTGGRRRPHHLRGTAHSARRHGLQRPRGPAAARALTEMSAGIRAFVLTTPGQGSGAERPGTLAGLLRCGICGRRLESCWADDRAAYRCRHGHTSAAKPHPDRPMNSASAKTTSWRICRRCMSSRPEPTVPTCPLGPGTSAITCATTRSPSSTTPRTGLRPDVPDAGKTTIGETR